MIDPFVAERAQHNFDELVERITKLEKRVAKLERATAPASKNPSVGVYYRDGKPCKRKPKKETEG